jgi:hypothetical protein
MQRRPTDRGDSGPISKTFAKAFGTCDAARVADGSPRALDRQAARYRVRNWFGTTTVDGLDRHDRTVELIGAPSS